MLLYWLSTLIFVSIIYVVGNQTLFNWFFPYSCCVHNNFLGLKLIWLICKKIDFFFFFGKHKIGIRFFRAWLKEEGGQFSSRAIQLFSMAFLVSLFRTKLVRQIVGLWFLFFYFRVCTEHCCLSNSNMYYVVLIVPAWSSLKRRTDRGGGGGELLMKPNFRV